MKENLNKYGDLIFLTIIYVGGFINLIDVNILDFNTALVRYTLLAVGALYFLLRFMYIYKNNLKEVLLPKIMSSSLILIWLIFSFSIIIAQIINAEIPYTGIMYIGLSFYLFMYVIPMVLNKPIRTIILAGFTSSLMMISTSVMVVRPAMAGVYTGFVRNSNQMGLLASLLIFTTLCILFLLNELKLNLISKLALLLVLLSSIVLLFLTQGRTSFLAIIFTFLLISILIIVFEKIKIKKIILPVMATSLLGGFLFKDLFMSTIWHKFLRKLKLELAGGGRLVTWKEVIDGWVIFGHGKDYFLYTTETAHNIVINFLGTYGFFPAFFIIVFFVLSLIEAFKFIKRNGQKLSSYMPFAFIVYFALFNLAEGVFGVIGITITLMYFNFVGLLMLEKINPINFK